MMEPAETHSQCLTVSKKKKRDSWSEVATGRLCGIILLSHTFEPGCDSSILSTNQEHFLMTPAVVFFITEPHMFSFFK